LPYKNRQVKIKAICLGAIAVFRPAARWWVVNPGLIGDDNMSEAVTVVACPFCEKQFRIQAKSLGAKLRCKGCEQIFTAEPSQGPQAPKGKPANPPKPTPAEKKPEKPKPDDDEEGGAYGAVVEEEVPRCPNCVQELESEDQVICLNCGFNNRTRTLNRVKRIQHKGFVDYLKWYAYPIFCTIMIITTASLLVLYYVRYRSWAIDNRAEDTVAWLLANQVSQIYIWVAALTVFWKCGKPAVMRFIVNPHPPEEEVFK